LAAAFLPCDDFAVLDLGLTSLPDDRLAIAVPNIAWRWVERIERCVVNMVERVTRLGNSPIYQRGRRW
jgi:hypothetical protein